MSFELHFYQPADQAPCSLQQIKEVLLASEHVHFVAETTSYLFEYENQITGVCFWFCLAATPYVDEEVRAFSGFRYTGLSFGVNYCRPSYFMYEANPILLRLVNQLQLYVFDPQADAASTVPFQPYSDELVRSWQAGNRRSSLKSPNRVTLSQEKAYSAWRYLYLYPHFKSSLSDQHFIPKLFFVRTKEGVKTSVVFPYPDVEHQLIPDVDYLYVKIPSKKWIFHRTVEGLVPFEQLRCLAPDAFSAVNEPIPHYLLVNPQPVETVLLRCRRLGRSEYTILENGSFIDIDPPFTA
ncbi:hypothetical protein [Effusibacillus dendaii]|uniref:Uncharacterized protein n=1 Tax=Effusibacillus dendaii TaxID=2743772 RepID=A0A7I8DB76_9BACL|nr:hypothetical protein [Effusibacillus dendaii]BCJ86602.1 hypothetical protein skT53_15870 [Effusibacillus dendaii]